MVPRGSRGAEMSIKFRLVYIYLAVSTAKILSVHCYRIWLTVLEGQQGTKTAPLPRQQQDHYFTYACPIHNIFSVIWELAFILSLNQF